MHSLTDHIGHVTSIFSYELRELLVLLVTVTRREIKSYNTYKQCSLNLHGPSWKKICCIFASLGHFLIIIIMFIENAINFKEQLS